MRVRATSVTIGNDQAIAIPFDLLGNGFVFHDLVLDAFMPADGIVDRAFDQDELSVGDGVPAVWVVDLAR
jgi:hypothetical protein